MNGVRSEMKLLFIGDVVGDAGVAFVKEKLWRIKKELI